MIATILFVAVVAGSLLFLPRPQTKRPTSLSRTMLLEECFALEKERDALFGEIRVVARTGGYDSDLVLLAWHLRQARIQWISRRIATIRRELDLSVVLSERQILILRSLHGGLTADEAAVLL